MNINYYETWCFGFKRIIVERLISTDDPNYVEHNDNSVTIKCESNDTTDTYLQTYERSFVGFKKIILAKLYEELNEVKQNIEELEKFDNYTDYKNINKK